MQILHLRDIYNKTVFIKACEADNSELLTILLEASVDEFEINKLKKILEETLNFAEKYAINSCILVWQIKSSPKSGNFIFYKSPTSPSVHRRTGGLETQTVLEMLNNY